MREYQYNPTGIALPRYGQDSNRFGVLTIPLDTAASKKKFGIGGSCLWAFVASSLSASVQIHINSITNDYITFKQGMYLRGIPFSEIYCTWSAQSGEYITFLYSVEGIQGIQVENAIADYTSITMTKAATLTPSSRVTLDAVLPGDTFAILATSSTRREAIIKADIGNSQEIMIGDSSISITKGYPLYPGETIVLDTKAAIYGGIASGGTEYVWPISIHD